MEHSPFLQTLEELALLTPHQIRKAFGGKALGLFEARQLGIAIPSTWLIGIDHFAAFTLDPSTEQKNYQKTAAAYLALRFQKNLAALPNGLFAVRSSSQFEDSVEHSFAGIFTSKLAVSKTELHTAIAEVWDSCHSLKAASYVQSASSLRMGVIIQPMIEAKYAGVCFSKHPSPRTVFENHNIVIEFAQAGGEKVVQGEITPYRFSGTAENLSSTTDAPWIDELLKAVIDLKNFHRHEVDIEFVVDKTDKFFLVQQRPVSRTHASHVLDLSHYQRKYKRSLFSLDIEFLIDGCARYLAPYLDLPYQLERWMVMITNLDGQQELWIHSLLDEAVISKLSQRFQEEPAFLEIIEKRYYHHVKKIRETDYRPFFDRKKPLEQRFFDWCEFLTPLAAHYYVPMFMIDALHLLLLRELKSIDAQKAEEDLFFLGTFAISSLMDLLNEELLAAKDALNILPERFSELPAAVQNQLSDLSKRYGFLKCHQVYENGYSAEDLFQIMNELLPKGELAPELFDKQRSLHIKYAASPHLHMLLEKFREWLRIRNQEMEYLMYAILNSRPLFEEIADVLNVTVQEVWNGSRELIVKAISKGNPQLLQQLPRQNLVIYHSYGKTRLSNSVKWVGITEEKRKDLRGKKVYGEGRLEAVVKIAFSPQELQQLGQFEKPHVLVTGMTTPDFIPPLKKHFSALITDEGGILCHAAIVAREISIPCIVGTGTATEILKNGMRVRIDFDLGEIEILDFKQSPSNLRKAE